jgi:hypothetical protein
MLSYLQCMFLHVDCGIETAPNKSISAFLQAVETTTNCPVHRLSSQLIDNSMLCTLLSELKSSASKTKKTILLVSGSHLEDQVTLCTLESLLEGFDVHIMCDLISARDVKLKSILLLKLFQAGAVPSTLRQFLFMWLAAETDIEMVDRLRQLLHDYDITFPVRHASATGLS